MNHKCAAIIDFGGENNQVAARLVRSLNVYCLVFDTDNISKKLTDCKAEAVIYVGSGDFAAEIKKLDIKLPALDLTNKTLDKAEIKSFLTGCGFTGDWKTQDFVDEMTAQLKQTIGGGKALLALSGGVDSSVCAALVGNAIGKNLTCVFVDTGLMRLNEGNEVVEAFSGKFGLNLIRVDAEARFLEKLAGVTEPEQKRRIIGEEFIRVFEEEAKKIGEVDFFVQGTIYPDIIESGTKSSAKVKSHHNVGGMPDVIDFKEILEPLKELFKDEVREVGLALGLPAHLVHRQPFPGPGLGVRVIGELTKEKLDILRQADFIFRSEIAKAGLDKSIWQYFAILTGVKSVGVTDSARTYGHTIALRAVHTIDAMSADIAHIPYEILEGVSDRIIAEVAEVNRVVYDVTKKPPGTIEWE